MPLRGELVGIRAASLGLFGHAPDALDEAESALLRRWCKPVGVALCSRTPACAVMKKDKAEECSRVEMVAATLPSHPLS